MAAIAAFASSDEGRFYAQVHKDANADPAATIGDPLVAYNFRAALAVARMRDATKSQAEIIPFPDGHTEVRGLDPFAEQ